MNDNIVGSYPSVVNLEDVKKIVLDLAYPVGSYFISDNSTDPSVQLGGGYGLNS